MSGRSAMNALRLHYEGEGEVNKRIGVARATLSTTIYRNEFAYSFEKFATRMKTAFTVLEKHGEPYAETAKVKMVHDRIQVPGNNLIQIAKSQLLDQHGASFSAAVSYMSRKVAEIFPEAFDQDVRRDNRTCNVREVAHVEWDAIAMAMIEEAVGVEVAPEMDATGDVVIVVEEEERRSLTESMFQIPTVLSQRWNFRLWELAGASM
jgi:hypothetical protein